MGDLDDRHEEGQRFPTVFVTVGTTKFDNLFKFLLTDEALMKLKELGCERLLIQAGTSNVDDLEFDHDLLKVEIYKYKESIIKDVEQADLVIGHAGAGTALDVLRANKPFLMVINDALMNNHQFELARTLRENDYVLYCSPIELNSTLEKVQHFQFKSFPEFKPTLFAGFLNEKLFGIGL